MYKSVSDFGFLCVLSSDFMFVTNKTANRSITVILLIVQEQFFVDVYGLDTATREKTVVINKLYNILLSLLVVSNSPGTNSL